MAGWSLKNASEEEKEIYRKMFEKTYKKEYERRSPVVQAGDRKSVV